MANPTLFDHSTTVSRKTAADVQRYVARMLGIDADEFTADEDTLFFGLLNDEVLEWRVFGAKRYSEQRFEHTWDGTDSSVALPLDFAEALGGHLWEIDTNGNVRGRVHFQSEQEFTDGFVEGSHGADFNDLPYARLWREEDTTRKRVLHIYPTPGANTVHRLDYLAYTEAIALDADVLEAPIAAHDGIQYGVAQRWAVLDGDDAAAQRMGSQKAQKLLLFTAPANNETKKRRRAMEFERDLGGYPGLTGSDTPQVRGNVT